MSYLLDARTGSKKKDSIIQCGGTQWMIPEPRRRWWSLVSDDNNSLTPWNYLYNKHTPWGSTCSLRMHMLPGDACAPWRCTCSLRRLMLPEALWQQVQKGNKYRYALSWEYKLQERQKYKSKGIFWSIFQVVDDNSSFTCVPTTITCDTCTSYIYVSCKRDSKWVQQCNTLY